MLVRRGGQRLCFSHEEVIEGRFTRLAIDAGQLVFRFEVTNTQLGRQVIRDIERGYLRGASIGIGGIVSRWKSYVREIHRAELVEISIARNPALWDTRVSVVK